MSIKYLAVVLAAACTPSWALYKCVVGGKTPFQEAPRESAQGQTLLKPQYVPEKIGAVETPRPNAVQTVKQMEQERLRHETEYALRDKREELARFRQQCAQRVNAIANDRFQFNDNLAGAVRGQAEAAAAQAQATTCDTQARTIEADLEDLRRRCTAQNCTPL